MVSAAAEAVGRLSVPPPGAHWALRGRLLLPAAKLIIELDGGQHAERQAADARRTAWFDERGYRVVRFWNNEVFENIGAVMGEIEKALNGI